MNSPGVTPNTVSYESLHAYSRFHSGHENVNERIENFECIDQSSLNQFSLQGVFFHALAQITSIMIREIDTIFSVV